MCVLPFLTRIGKKSLVADKRLFIGKVNPKWWSELVELAKEHLEYKKFAVVVLYSAELEEHFMAYYHPKKSTGELKLKCIYTNAFDNRVLTKTEKDLPGMIFEERQFSE